MLPAGSTAEMYTSVPTYVLYLLKSDYPQQADYSYLSSLGYSTDYTGYVTSSLDAHFFPNGAGDHDQLMIDTSDPNYVMVGFSPQVSGTVGGQQMSAFALQGSSPTGARHDASGSTGVANPSGFRPGLFGFTPTAPQSNLQRYAALFRGFQFRPTATPAVHVAGASYVGRGYVPTSKRQHLARGFVDAQYAMVRRHPGISDHPGGRSSWGGRHGPHDDELT
jgi:hypothetical protein